VGVAERTAHEIACVVREHCEPAMAFGRSDRQVPRHEMLEQALDLVRVRIVLHGDDDAHTYRPPTATGAA
jgi:hypothetical protein